MVPKPSKNHTYCGICRVRYEDYLEHVAGIVHSQKIKKAKYAQNIDKFVKILQKKNKRIEKQKKIESKPARRGRPPKKVQEKPNASISDAIMLPFSRSSSTEP